MTKYFLLTCYALAGLSLAPFAAAQEAPTAKITDLNTLVISGDIERIDGITTDQAEGVYSFPNQKSLVLLGSPAMTENRLDVIGDDADNGMMTGDGKTAKLGQFRWQVALVDPIFMDAKDGQFCGGVILSKTWILTAAHCVFSAYSSTFTIPPANVNVVAGSVTLDENVTRLKVRRIEIHDAWKRGARRIPYDSDIALLELAAPLAESKTIGPVQLVSAEQEGLLDSQRQVRIAGWGRTKVGDANSGSRDLLWMDINVISNTDCQTYGNYLNGVTGNMFCAARFGNGACKGDSGSPAISIESDPAPLVGIVSWANRGCTTPDGPGVYVRVSKYLDWIRSKML